MVHVEYLAGLHCLFLLGVGARQRKSVISYPLAPILLHSNNYSSVIDKDYLTCLATENTSHPVYSRYVHVHWDSPISPLLPLHSGIPPLSTSRLNYDCCYLSAGSDVHGDNSTARRASISIQLPACVRQSEHPRAH